MATNNMLLLVLLLAGVLVNADVYMHNPRGSNNRGCERNDNRNNDNRLFDSQNNNKGGYACPFAWPLPCYIIEDEAARDECNRKFKDEDWDDIANMSQPLLEEDGITDEMGTKTPKLYFYQGSQLQIEWTNQHGCGENPRTHCDIILQYACEDTLADECGEPGSGKYCGPRDGRPIMNYDNNNRGSATYTNIINGNNENRNRRDRDQQVTTTIPVSIDHNVQADLRFGRHEGIEHYIKCHQRERNKGLFIGDNGRGPGATRTRQNAGTRYGFECAEEAEYYPYWHPSPWKDIAILTDRTHLCSYFTSESQNVKAKYECNCQQCLENANGNKEASVPNNQRECIAKGGSWDMVPAHNRPAPYCGPAPTTRENQLGGDIGGGKSSSAFNWTIPWEPQETSKTCVLRLRYNISTGDIDEKTGQVITLTGDYLMNKDEGDTELYDRETRERLSYYKHKDDALADAPGAELGMAVNTDQFGRTFQDRSWSFEIRPPPSAGECKNKQIYNLNVRGKRGNIVQAYPNVEYDFVPSEMYITESDCVHVQWTGSDYNPARNSNNAYGGPPDPTNLNDGRADRTNLVQTYDGNHYKIVDSLDNDWLMFQTSRQRKINLAWIGQPIEDTRQCLQIETILALSEAADEAEDPRDNGDPDTVTADGNNGGQWLDDNNDRDRYWRNCGKLSGAQTPYFDGGLFVPYMPFGSVHTTWYYMCTRNNSFSNRNQQGILHVIWSPGVVFAFTGGSAIALTAMLGLFFFAGRRPRPRYNASDVNEHGLVLAGGGAVRRESPASAGMASSAPKRAKPATPGDLSGAAGGASNTVTALYNHQASEAGELEFRKGDKIIVLRKDDSGWWEGKTAEGKRGIFPANYVQ